jgi:hypothetical protein
MKVKMSTGGMKPFRMRAEERKAKERAKATGGRPKAVVSDKVKQAIPSRSRQQSAKPSSTKPAVGKQAAQAEPIDKEATLIFQGCLMGFAKEFLSDDDDVMRLFRKTSYNFARRYANGLKSGGRTQQRASRVREQPEVIRLVNPHGLFGR